jgi:hypothetical protein
MPSPPPITIEENDWSFVHHIATASGIGTYCGRYAHKCMRTVYGINDKRPRSDLGLRLYEAQQFGPLPACKECLKNYMQNVPWIDYQGNCRTYSSEIKRWIRKTYRSFL